jgi:predicted nucleic acid-binding protein
MAVVSDTGPLIALAKVDQLALLQQLFGQVLIPPMVQRELFAKYGVEFDRLNRALPDILHVASVSSVLPQVEVATLRLDPGERQAIALAYEQSALLLIDDRLGRAAAQSLGLAVTGIIGLLLRAKELGLVAGVRPMLEDMRDRGGYWLSDRVLDKASRLAGEA